MNYRKQQISIRNLTTDEGCFESPINITIKSTKEIQLPPLEWIHFEHAPKKSKITNTGRTVIFSAKWYGNRPYIQKGPFIGRYVFSNWHLHWGKHNNEGSEHTIEGTKLPLEMHVVLFKSSYLTQESALKEQDGCSTLVYLFKLHDVPNPHFQKIVDALHYVSSPGSSRNVDPMVITHLIRVFTVDYFMYWGSVSTEGCRHYILWLISRFPIRVSAEQINRLRFLFNQSGKHILRNFRKVQRLENRTIFHVCPSHVKYSTLLDGDHAHLHGLQGHPHEHIHEHGHEHVHGHEHDHEHGHKHEHGHEHLPGHVHEHQQGHEHQHGHEYGHEHDGHKYGHEHEHEHGHGYEHGHEHQHGHEYGHEHGHDHGHEHDGHKYGHEHEHQHEHQNGYEHQHGHEYGHEHGHDHGNEQDGHKYGHEHEHEYGHEHEHGHEYRHEHGHDHEHEYDGHKYGHEHEHEHGHEPEHGNEQEHGLEHEHGFGHDPEHEQALAHGQWRKRLKSIFSCFRRK